MTPAENWLWVASALVGLALIPACRVFASNYEPRPIRVVEWALTLVRRVLAYFTHSPERLAPFGIRYRDEHGVIR